MALTQMPMSPYNMVMMGLMQYSDLQKNQAETQHIDEQTKLTQAATQETQQKMAMQQQLLASQKQWADVNMQNMLAGGNPNQNAPGTPSIAETKQQFSVPNPMQDQYAANEKQAQLLDAKINMARSIPGIGHELITPMVTERDNLRTSQRQLALDISNRNEKDSKEMAQLIGGIDSQQKLLNLVPYVEQRFGKAAAMQVNAQLSKDSNNMPILDDSTRAALAMYHDQFTDAATQANKEFHGAEINNWGVQRDQEDQRIAETSRQHDIESANQQASVRAANTRAYNAQAGENARAAARLEVMGGFKEQQIATGIEGKANQQLQNDPVVKTLPIYQNGYNVAQSVIGKLSTNPDWDARRNLSEPEIRTMLTQYTQMQQNFRNRAGATNYTTAQEKQYSGLLERANTYLISLGKGGNNNIPSRSLIDIAGDMNRMHQEWNASAAERGLATMNTVYKQGGDPTNVRSYADIKMAVDAGRARMLPPNPETGETYIEFGNGGPERTYLIPTGPKQRPRMNPSVIGALLNQGAPVPTE